MNEDDVDIVKLTQQLLTEFEGSKAAIHRIQRSGVCLLAGIKEVEGVYLPW
jgi:hypothetical protein